MKKAFLFLFSFISIIAFPQSGAVPPNQIYLNLQKLNVLGSVMYIAAHPDDENTLLLTWLSKDQKVQTAYIAMTRGDGGQNLIGTEQGSNAGLLRTQELLKARSIDGAKQYFTRAIDFGYTKTTDEALQTWGKEQILSDLIYRIRKFKPDVLITRFPPDERAGHGHHSASAVLAAEAFEKSNDASVFPEQLKEVEVWQPKRLLWNYYSRGFRNQTPEEGNYVEVALGSYNSLLGESYPEIAAEARSMHKSQGFGSAKVRDSRTDYLLLIKGEKFKNSLFDGIDISWNRIKDGALIEKKVNDLISTFEFTDPSKSVSKLATIYADINNLEDTHYKKVKLEEVKKLIQDCSGLWIEALASNQFVSQGDSASFFLQTNKRSNVNVKLSTISFLNKSEIVDKELKNNELVDIPMKAFIGFDHPITQPYWLINKPEKGFYIVNDKNLIGMPFQPSAIEAEFTYIIDGVELTFKTPVVYKFVEPSSGEIYQPFIVRPEVTVNFKESIFTFTTAKPKEVVLTIKSAKNNVEGSIGISLPDNWKVTPERRDFKIIKKNDEFTVSFLLTPPSKEEEIELEAIARIGDRIYTNSMQNIDYKHIPLTTTFKNARAKAIYFDLKTKGTTIGYIKGAGDEVPNALQTMGYTIIDLNANNLDEMLPLLSTVVIGVRAYNTEDWLPLQQNKLMDFVEKGGTLVTQYQTSAFYGPLKSLDMGPFPFKIGRSRVTDENSRVEFTNQAHPLLNYPNKITNKDFEGWIQERGLYFAEGWSDKYSTILKMKDTGESELEGSLLYAKYGKGNFIFTGLSFFRQLPAGVSGAYRLFANLVSAGQ